MVPSSYGSLPRMHMAYGVEILVRFLRRLGGSDIILGSWSDICDTLPIMKRPRSQ